MLQRGRVNMKFILLAFCSLFLVSCGNETVVIEKFENFLNKKHENLVVTYWVNPKHYEKAVESKVKISDAKLVKELLSKLEIKSSAPVSIGVSEEILIDYKIPMCFVFPDKVHAQIDNSKSSVYAFQLKNDNFYKALKPLCLKDSHEKGHEVKLADIELWVSSIHKEIIK